MRIAIIENGLVVNVVEAQPDFAPGSGFVAVATETAGPGWSYDGAAFHPPAASLPPVPESVTMFQAREALRRTPAPDSWSLRPPAFLKPTKARDRMTMLEAVDAYVAAHEAANPSLTLAWEYAAEVSRHGAFVTAFAGEVGLDDAALDALFRVAAGIEA